MNKLDKLMDETLDCLKRGQSATKGENRVSYFSAERYTFDGMKLARELALISFYNATCEYIPKSKLKEAFTEFYKDLDHRIINVGRSGDFTEEKDKMFGAIVNVLSRVGIPREKWREFI